MRAFYIQDGSSISPDFGKVLAERLSPFLLMNPLHQALPTGGDILWMFLLFKKRDFVENVKIVDAENDRSKCIYFKFYFSVFDQCSKGICHLFSF